jgi:hypothetical protein
MLFTGKLVAFEPFNDGDEAYRAWWKQEQSPRLSELLRDVVIAQTVSRGNVSITLFSLESYTEGFAVQGRYWLEEGHPVLDDIRRRWEEVRRNNEEAAQGAPSALDDDARSSSNLRILSGQPIARFEPTAADDRGNRYQSGLFDGRGRGEAACFSYAFKPQLGNSVRGLQIEFPALHWLVREPGGDRRIDGESELGPWTFSIPLPSGAG